MNYYLNLSKKTKALNKIKTYIWWGKNMKNNVLCNEHIKKKNLCKECKGMLKKAEFETYCKDCGLVADDSPVNFGKEGFEGDPEKAAKKRRTGAPITWRNPHWGTTFDLRKLYKGRRPRWV